MTLAGFGYYEESYPPELWETPAAPVGAARPAADEGSTVPGGTVLPATAAEVQGADQQEGALEAGPDSPGAVRTADGVEHVGILPAAAALQGQVLEVDPDSPIPGTVETTEADVPDVALPDFLTVTAGAPASYFPPVKPAERPRNVTELRQRAQPADPSAVWEPGQYVVVGENGKRAWWDGETWQRGEAPPELTRAKA